MSNLVGASGRDKLEQKFWTHSGVDYTGVGVKGHWADMSNPKQVKGSGSSLDPKLRWPGITLAMRADSPSSKNLVSKTAPIRDGIFGGSYHNVGGGMKPTIHGGSGGGNMAMDKKKKSMTGGNETGFWGKFKGNSAGSGQMGWGHVAVGALGAVALDRMFLGGGAPENVYNQQQTGPRYQRTYNYYR